MLPILQFQKHDLNWLAKKMQKRSVPSKNTPGDYGVEPPTQEASDADNGGN